MADSELQWRAPEFEERLKDVSWYWASIIAAVLILSFALWQKNFLFAVFILIAELLMLVWGNRAPQMITFSLDATTLTVGGKSRYALGDMEHFSVAESTSTEWISLILHPKRGVRLPVTIHAPKSQLADIEKRLVAKMPKAEHEESFLDTLEKFLGF